MHVQKMDADNSRKTLVRARQFAAAGHLEAARGLAASVCETDAHNAEGWLLLGNVLGKLQRFNEAIESLGRAATLEPADSVTHSCLANALYAAGRIDSAVSACKRALEIQPDNADNWYLLSSLCSLSGKLAESGACLHRVIELVPMHAQAHRSLGYVLQASGHMEEALENYKRAVECKPDFADAYNDIGVVLEDLGQATEAVSYYEAALRIRPEYLDAMVNLGSLLLTLYRLADAERYFNSALAINRNNARALCGLGSIQLERGMTDDAYANFRMALHLDPAYEEVTVKMARLHERQGDYDEALSLLQPLMEGHVNADAVTAFALLSPHLHLEDKAIGLLKCALDNGGMPSAQEMAMHLTLGRLYDKKDEYDLAYRNFREGNDMKSANYNHADHVRLVDALTRTYSMENLNQLAHAPPSDRQSVFIVGMPRSGTSLAEQILAAHPDVQAAGELNTINGIAARLHDALQTGRPYPVAAMHLTPDTIEGFVRDYMDVLTDEGVDRPFFTDKMPHNFLHLGLIQQLFPNARVIHCVRDARDTCFSCYTYDFNGEHPYAYGLETLGEYYLQYQRLMKHWMSVLKIPIYQLDYEQLIDDQEQEIRRLVSFCGLEWNDRCLDFHASRRFVLTSSYDQVRRPIYNSSIGRWKHYERHIQPLLRVLERGK